MTTMPRLRPSSLQGTSRRQSGIGGRQEINTMAKRVEKVFKVLAPGGQATPAPPLGPVLGANGVNPGQ